MKLIIAFLFILPAFGSVPTIFRLKDTEGKTAYLFAPVAAPDTAKVYQLVVECLGSDRKNSLSSLAGEVDDVLVLRPSFVFSSDKKAVSYLVNQNKLKLLLLEIKKKWKLRDGVMLHGGGPGAKFILRYALKNPEFVAGVSLFAAGSLSSAAIQKEIAATNRRVRFLISGNAPVAGVLSGAGFPIFVDPTADKPAAAGKRLLRLIRFQPAFLVLPNPPPPRSYREVEAILGAALKKKPENVKPLRILLCASPKDAAHIKPGYHDYPIWLDRWSQLLNFADGVTVDTTNAWPTTCQWDQNDVVVFNSYNPDWALQRDSMKVAELGRQMDAFLARGGGIVFIHYALNSGPNAFGLAKRLGLAWGKGSRYRHEAADWDLDKTHPLSAGFDEFKLPDESYWNLTGNLSAANADILSTSREDQAPRPQMWTREVGPGRVFVSIPGHFTWTFDDPLYRILVLRGICWSARQPMDRLAPLVTVGARITD